MTEKRKNDDAPTIQTLLLEKYHSVDPLRRVGCLFLIGAAFTFAALLGLAFNWWIAEITAVVVAFGVLVIIAIWLMNVDFE